MLTLLALQKMTNHCVWLMLLLAACGPLPASAPPESPADPIAGLIDAAPETATAPADIGLEKMGFSIQVGAFSQVENAARLERSLDSKGLDAYYFRDSSGLFKVRFGNHRAYREARAQAENLQRQGTIGNFFIVIPESYSAAQIAAGGKGDLRQDLVSTARHFLGVPYLWGGESAKGFDCSGLAMVCYRLNGLNLPRNSRTQYQRGQRVAKNRLQKGDLVFFATQGGRRVTHVGLYIGGGRFIHAPRTGKTVREARLDSSYWSKFFVGGRSYL